MRFPVQIRCSIPYFEIADDAIFFAMSEQDKAEYLQVNAAIYDQDGWLSGHGPFSHGIIFPRALVDRKEILGFGSSNYFIETSSVETAENIRTAIKLFSRNATTLSVGFEGRSPWEGVVYLHPVGFYGQDFLVLDEQALPKFESVFRTVSIAAKKDRRTELILEKFLYAVSSNRMSNEHRLLELAIILEMLILPQNQTELSYRFGLRAGRLWAKYFGEDIKSTFHEASTIYKVRSKLAHEGEHKDTKALLPAVMERTRKTLLLYLNNPERFTVAAFDALCLE
jgi:hypothetical protein